mgnify:CR=1 FL=1|jgi:hypothetical protein
MENSTLLVSESFGDKLCRINNQCRNALFLQGEMAQLTYQALNGYTGFVEQSQDEKIEIRYPIGYRADHTTIDGVNTYTKEELIGRYQFLTFNQLPVNGIYQLVTATEFLLGSIIREVLMSYPNKIPNRRKIDVEVVLSGKSLDEVKLYLVNQILNELAYKSPREYAEEFEKIVGIKLLEQPVFHRYLELKATRDIHIHNSGIANEIYLTKAATLARVKAGEYLPVDLIYFLQSYEVCLQITEILERELNNIWPSQEYLNYKNQNFEEQQKKAVETAIETAEVLEDNNIIKEASPIEKYVKIKKVATKKSAKNNQ